MAAIETYVSTDIEADGPIPGPHSMLSLGSAAFNEDGRLLDTFTTNLVPLSGAVPHPRYAEFWEGNPEALAATQVDRCDPEQAMRSYVAWVEALPGLPVFVAYPAGFDFTFVHYYLHRFTGGSPFSHSALDMKTLAMLLLHTGYRRATKRRWPREWFPRNSPHTHRALDDAIEQGREFGAMLTEARRLPPRLEHPRGAASRGRAGSGPNTQEWPAPAPGADIRADLLALQEYGRGDPADQRPVPERVRSVLRQPSEVDRQVLIQTLVGNIRLRLPDLRKLLEFV